MTPPTDLDQRLRQRWAKKGGGPKLEQRLKAAEAELSRRANVQTAERKGVQVPSSSRVPVADPRGLGKENDDTTSSDTISKPSTPSIPIDTDAVIQDALKTTRAQTARAAARERVDPNSIGHPSHPNFSHHLEAEESSDDEETLALEAACVVVGETELNAKCKHTIVNPAELLDQNNPLVKLKNEANAALTSCDYELAVALYDETIAHATSQSSTGSESRDSTPTVHTNNLLAVTYSNRSRAKMLLDPPDAIGSSSDASKSIALKSEWFRPYLRKAVAEALLGNWKSAVRNARSAEIHAQSARDSKATQECVTTLDSIAIAAATEGSTAGFDGRIIYVRSAGEDAWLCKEAPTNPAFDEEDGHTAVNENGMYTCGNADQNSSSGKYDNSSINSKKPIHARSLLEAVEKAHDGDKILLLRGIHNGCGDSVTVTKRICISGEGQLREASIDARNNSPVFRIKRNCWIRNVEFDFTGFSEAIRTESDSQSSFEFIKNPTPLIERCAIKCTGADAVVCASSSHPTFRDCSFEAKKCGVRVCDTSEVFVVDCKFTNCQTQGLRVTDSGAVKCSSCVFSENLHEGIVATMSSKVTLTSCSIHSNLGPGVDTSNDAFVKMKNSKISNNTGGVWAWDTSNVEIENSKVDGGTSHAILIDENATCVCVSDTVITGVVHCNDSIRRQITPGLDNSCVLVNPDTPTDLPNETGCFKFEHDQYTRKQ